MVTLCPGTKVSYRQIYTNGCTYLVQLEKFLLALSCTAKAVRQICI